MNWVSYFEKNRAERRPIEWEKGIDIDPRLRDAFVHSLQRFQVGESGEGRHMKKGAAATGDAEYAQAVHLFIAEEQTHASLMAEMLGRVGAPLIERHWSDVIFVGMRRLIGLNMEVMVILCAEIIGRNYFRALRDGIGDPVTRSIMAQIARDEEGHIAFQCDRLRKSFARLPRFASRLMHVILWVMYQAAFLVVIYDHRDLLRALAVSPGEFMRDCDRTFDEAGEMIFNRARVSVRTLSDRAGHGAGLARSHPFWRA